MERAVNASAYAYGGSNPPSPIAAVEANVSFVSPTAELTIWGKRRVTLPLRPWEVAGFNKGDRLRVQAAGPGRLVLERIELPAAVTPFAKPAQPELTTRAATEPGAVA